MNSSFDQSHALTLPSTAAGVANRVLRVGDVIGGSYRLKSLLGRGGMGYVFCAEHVMIQRDYALKMLAPEQLNEASRRRFEVEGKAIANLDHPSIVKVYNMGVDEGNCPFYVMDLLAGRALSDYIAGGNDFGFKRWVDIFIQIASGLGYAHSKGIVHRDVKPSNIILLEGSGGLTAKIVDFGIAKLLPSADLHTQSQTATGEVFGSPYYMSPEQSQGAAVDLRTDIYSLGCTWYEALCGRPPYRGESPLSTILMHQSADIPSIVNDRPDKNWPDAADFLLEKMMAKRPENRYQTMQQVVHDLERMKAGRTIGKVEVTPVAASGYKSYSAGESPVRAEKDNNFIKPAFAVLALLVVAVGGVALWYQLFPPKTAVDKILEKKVQQVNPPVGMEEDGSEDKVRKAILTTAPEKSLSLFLSRTKSANLEQEEREFPQVKEAYDAAGPIRSTIVETSSGRRMRRFVFPTWSIGRVIILGAADYDALKTVMVPADRPVDFYTGSRVSHHVFQCPEVLKKIGRDEFEGLWLHGQKVSGVTSSIVGARSETVGLIPMLQTTSQWTRLKRVALTNLSLPREVLAVLDRFKNLEAVRLRAPVIKTADLLQTKFIDRVPELEFSDLDNVSLIVPRLAASRYLKKLVLDGCYLTVNDIRELARSKTLERFELREDHKRFEVLLPELVKMSRIKTLAVEEPDLSPQQIRTITACPTIESLVLNVARYRPDEIERYRHMERKVIFEKW
ncbi:MAG: serine/threonine protein kinase [Cyanobacteria bacterium SZAS LIN-3]|nr:serine/threonine protein kinase [Cyanobacteria bacterium SZAS LIN-3]MBS2005973.1 serine/threonine protein kinase [Cyanobacteria bacterium SZAS TMP-1]